MQCDRHRHDWNDLLLLGHWMNERILRMSNLLEPCLTRQIFDHPKICEDASNYEQELLLKLNYWVILSIQLLDRDR